MIYVLAILVWLLLLFALAAAMTVIIGVSAGATRNQRWRWLDNRMAYSVAYLTAGLQVVMIVVLVSRGN